MLFNQVKKGHRVTSVYNLHTVYIVLEVKRGGWVLIRPVGNENADLRFNVRAGILSVNKKVFK